MTNLVPQTHVSDTDLAELLKTVTPQKPKAPERPLEETKSVGVTQDAKDALSSLVRLLEAAKVPSTRRELTTDELVQLHQLTKIAKKAKKAVENIEGKNGVARKAVFNHLDRELERSEGAEVGEADYELDDEGHYLAEGEIPIPGQGEKFVRQLNEKSPSIADDDLFRLYKEGKISKEFYYGATRHVDAPRTIVNTQLAKELSKHPEYLHVLSEEGAITPGGIYSSFHIRKL